MILWTLIMHNVYYGQHNDLACYLASCMCKDTIDRADRKEHERGIKRASRPKVPLLWKKRTSQYLWVETKAGAYVFDMCRLLCWYLQNYTSIKDSARIRRSVRMPEQNAKTAYKTRRRVDRGRQGRMYANNEQNTSVGRRVWFRYWQVWISLRFGHCEWFYNCIKTTWFTLKYRAVICYLCQKIEHTPNGKMCLKKNFRNDARLIKYHLIL